MNTCQNCRENFIATDSERGFYKKMRVPTPIFCPMCRLQRRMTLRNERSLYARDCSGSGNRMISYFDTDAPFPVYSREYWYGDQWDGTDYGRDYDFSKPFFTQFAELAKVAPRLQMWIVNSTNSDYSNYVVESNDCYLCFTALGGNERCSYCSYLQHSTECFDCYLIDKCERCYECLNCDNSYNLKFSRDSSNCRDSAFLIECNDCSSCVGCVGLRGKQHCILNEQYTKEEYQVKLAELRINTRAGIARLRQQVNELAKHFPRRYMHGRKNEDVTGDYIQNSKNVHDGYLIASNEDCEHVYFTRGLKSSQDVTVSTLANEQLYECHALPKQNSNMKFCDLCSNGCHDLEYCVNCDSSSNLFGCIGLRGKEYCILNKQYSKEEYEQLVVKIKSQMKAMPYKDAKGRVYAYGEMFPIELSPFAYNETVAYEFFPLSKEQAIAQGYRWKEAIAKQHQPTLVTGSVPENANEALSKEIVQCAHDASCSHQCTAAFKLTSAELQFYGASNIPVPTLCPNCRHFERIKVRNSLKLWNQSCACNGSSSKDDIYKNQAVHAFHSEKPCPNKFMTAYPPQGKEIIYCEQCYQQESS
jgi:hypothetical protein